MPTVIDCNRDSPFIEACGYNGGGSFPVEANGIAAQAITTFVTGVGMIGVRPRKSPSCRDYSGHVDAVLILPRRGRISGSDPCYPYPA